MHTLQIGEQMQQDKQVPQQEQLPGQVSKQFISSVHGNAVWIHDFFCFLAERDKKHCLGFNYLKKNQENKQKVY